MKLLTLTALILTASCAAPEVDSGPDTIQLRSAISTALLGGDVTTAEMAAREAESTLPGDVVVALLAAEAHAASGNPNAAIASLDRAIIVATTDEVLRHAYRNRGSLYMQAGRSTEAFDDLQQANDLGDSSVALLRDLGAAAYGSGNFQAARAAWEQLPDNDRKSVDTIVGPGFFLEKSVSINR